MSTLDLSFEEVFEHLARGDARGVEEGDVVERRGQHVREAEGQHERDPSYIQSMSDTVEIIQRTLTHP